jgi:hypothetical protein
MRAALVALCCVACGCVACGPSIPAVEGATPTYPGELIPVAALPTPDGLGEAFVVEQRAEFETPEGHYGFRAVVQRQGDTLTMVGFGPGGRRAFTLVQEDAEVTYTSQMPRELPFPPRFMLLDVQRVYFQGLPGPQVDGEHRAEARGEAIVETWRDGRLRRRRFTRLDGAPEGVIDIDYGEGLGGGAPPPRRVTVDNGWFGYHLTLTTLRHQTLE